MSFGRPIVLRRKRPQNAVMANNAVRIGILHDFPSADRGTTMEEYAHLGAKEVVRQGRLDADIEFVHASGLGLPLPGGSADAVEKAFTELADGGVLAILGPAITDNTFVVQPLCDQYGLVALNYAGAEASRSKYMFHFQIGSLEDEPAVLAENLASRNLIRLGVIHDSSYIGRRKAEFLEHACPVAGTRIVTKTMVSLEATDVTATVTDVRSTEPDALVYLGMWTPARALAEALASLDWDVPVAANSALIYGYSSPPEWRERWRNWVYMDTVADDNPVYCDLLRRAPGMSPGPILAGGYDMGRLLAEALARAPIRTREGVRIGMERIKRVPSATGMPGTTMGFGVWDREALKGDFLVPRQWEGQTSVQWRPPSAKSNAQ
jgi:branched-chain amino acid transport system substrate-binding protein